MEKEQKKTPQTVFWIILLLFFIVLGFTVSNYFLSKKNPSNGNDKNIVFGEKIPIKIVFSQKCLVCEKNHSITSFFKQKNIGLNIELVDADGLNGKEIVKEFDLNSLPIALVKARDVNKFSGLPELFKKNFFEKNGFFIIPEIGFDGRSWQTMLLFSPKNNSCEEEKNKAVLEEFFDFQCAHCWNASNLGFDLNQKFGEELIFKKRSFVIFDKPSEEFAIAYECAKLLGKGAEFESELFNSYFAEKAFSNSIAFDTEVKKFFIIDENFFLEIGKAAKRSGINDINAFSRCIDKKETKEIAGIESGYDNALAREYGLRFTPSFVMDCKFIIGGTSIMLGGKQLSLEEAICLQRPELKACSKISLQ